MKSKNNDLSFTNYILSLSSNFSKKEIKEIVKAWEYAKLAHSGQKRLTGEDYVFHPLEVAKTLAFWGLDATSIVAGLLHDTIEDGGATREDIVTRFGDEVAKIVDGVTKVAELRLVGSHEERFVENLRKMFLVMASDLRVVIVKLADRLHNMRTLSPLPHDKQKRISQETVEVYSALAERLGMEDVASELNDLAFPYLNITNYKRVTKQAKSFYEKAALKIEKMRKRLLKELEKVNLRAEIHGRKKGLYSLWKKLERPGIDWDFDKIYDIIALRIVVESVSDCYTSLGIVHNIYKPVPNLGISDFIAQPKPNGYQSIHTKVFGEGGGIVEIQIRTHWMHEEAEHGIAAHWAYGEGKRKGISDNLLHSRGVSVPVSKLVWVKQLVDWQKEIKDSKEFLKAVKFDALNHRNFIFSPKGDIYDLPSGATPVDFAYAVHTGLGDYIKHAKVDGKLVSLDYKLRSGQVVEIIKSKNKRSPSRDWLRLVVTTAARREIKKRLRM